MNHFRLIQPCFLKSIEMFPGGEGGVVLWIWSDSDDLMGENIKTQRNP